MTVGVAGQANAAATVSQGQGRLLSGFLGAADLDSLSSGVGVAPAGLSAIRCVDTGAYRDAGGLGAWSYAGGWSSSSWQS